MESAWSFLIWSIIILLPALLLLLLRQWKSDSNRLPPGPPVWSHVQSWNHATQNPSRAHAVVWLRIGAINTMVVLTAKTAAESFKNHDISFGGQTITEPRGLVTTQRAPSAWLRMARRRMLRRICAMEMLVSKRINETMAIRKKCIDGLVKWLEKEEKQMGGIHVARFVFLASFIMIGYLMLSRDLVDPESKECSEFFTAMAGVTEWSGHPNISDLFPWLSRLDLQGLRRKMDRDMGKALQIASGFVEERIK